MPHEHTPDKWNIVKNYKLSECLLADQLVYETIHGVMDAGRRHEISGQRQKTITQQRQQ